MHSSVNIQKTLYAFDHKVFGYMCKKLDSARMYEILCVSVSILRGKILVKTDFLRYKFDLISKKSISAYIKLKGVGSWYSIFEELGI